MTTRKRRRGSSDPLPIKRRGPEYFLASLEHLHIRVTLVNGEIQITGDRLSDAIRDAVYARVGQLYPILRDRIERESDISF